MDYSHYPQLYFGFTNNQPDLYDLESNLFSDIDTDDLLNSNNNIFNCGIYQSTIQRNLKVQRLKKREQLVNNYINKNIKGKFINNSDRNIHENRVHRQNIIYENKDKRPNMIYNNINNNIISSYKTISNNPNTIIHIYQPIYKESYSHNRKKYNSMNNKRITSNNNLTDTNLRSKMVNMKMKNNMQFHNNYNILNYNDKNLYKDRQNYNSYGKRMTYHPTIQRVKSNYFFNIKNINQYNNKLNNNNQLINNDLLDIMNTNNNFNVNIKNNNSLRNLNIFRKNQTNKRNNSNSNINRKIASNINKNDDENENLSKLAEELIKTFKKNKIKKDKNYKPNNQSQRDIRSRKEKSEFGCQISLNENNKNEKIKPEMKEEGIDVQNSLLQYISPLNSYKSSNKEEDIKDNNKDENAKEIDINDINENIGISSGSENNRKDNDNSGDNEYKQNEIKIKNNNNIDNTKESENKKSKIKRHIKIDLDNNTYFNFLIDDLIKYCQFKRGVNGDIEQFEEREIPQFGFQTRKTIDLKPSIKKFNKNEIKINKEYIPCENLREEEILPELYNENTSEELTEKLIKELAISLESSIEKNLNNSRQSINQSNSQSYNQSYSDVYDSTNVSNNNNLNTSTLKTILSKLSNSRFDIIEEKSESEIDEEK